MIYLLEDDDNIRELVVYTLVGSGLEARGFARPSLFYASLKEETPSLILLDIMLPEEDGLSILKKLRSSDETKEIPIIMLTAKGSEYDRVIGLDSGADDYIPKPFGMMELVARVRAMLRRTEKKEEASFDEVCEGALRLCKSTHTVFVSDEEVALTLKEFNTLTYLLDNRGTVLSRDAILSHVWGYSFDGENRTVDVHIRTLRRKLGEAGTLIETVRGVGYRIRKGN